MGDQPQQPTGPTTISPDGLWFWDGTQWRSAISPDRRWRWDGRTWVPFTQPTTAHGGGGGAATAVLITVLAFGGILVLVSIVVIVVLLTMGNQISNVFSNVAAALTSTPSP
jgi:Flp pilus assembly pilin Flp